MPPRAPNLKFKPKLVARGAAPTQEDATDDITTLQLARLHREMEHHAPEETSPLSSSTPALGISSEDPSRVGATAAPTAAAARRGGTGASRVAAAAYARRINLDSLPAEAPPLPVNSINHLVSKPVDAADGSSRPHEHLYPPLPLDSSLSSRVCTDNAVTVVAPTATNSTAEVDGTLFLREGEEEQKRIYAANRRFHAELLETHCGSAEEGDHGVDGRTQPPLIWMQFPRCFSDPALHLAKEPPGKVGELRVHKSGRVTMEIAGVHFDVAVEDYGPLGSNDGTCATAVATQPPPPPSTSDEAPQKSSCFQLGLLEKKLVCTPTITEERATSA